MFRPSSYYFALILKKRFSVGRSHWDCFFLFWARTFSWCICVLFASAYPCISAARFFHHRSSSLRNWVYAVDLSSTKFCLRAMEDGFLRQVSYAFVHGVHLIDIVSKSRDFFIRNSLVFVDPSKRLSLFHSPTSSACWTNL